MYYFRAFHKMRKITTKNKSGDSYGITIPSFIGKKFDGVMFNCSVSGSTIILESGAKL